jgi:suppressor for copper-sensitivity B
MSKEFFMRFLVAVLGILLPLSPVTAGESPWQDHQGMLRTRLVAASADMTSEQGVLLAWEAELEPGWKTYWRSPGEAGLPVRLFRDGKPVEIEYPLPHRFELFGLETYGYSGKVMLPFYLPAGGKAVEVAADFMVCKDICVPFQARYQLAAEDVAEQGSLHDIRLASWLKQVPDRQGDGGAGLEILGAKVMGPPGHQRVVVDTRADVDLSRADMLAEVDGMFHFGAPEMRLMEDGTKARFVLTGITGKKPEDLKGRTIRLTFTDGHGHAVDQKIELAR